MCHTLSHTEAFTHRHFYTQTLLHADAFTHTHTLSHTEAFTHRRFYTQALLPTEAFTHTHTRQERIFEKIRQELSPVTCNREEIKSFYFRLFIGVLGLAPCHVSINHRSH